MPIQDAPVSGLVIYLFGVFSGVLLPFIFERMLQRPKLTLIACGRGAVPGVGAAHTRQIANQPGWLGVRFGGKYTLGRRFDRAWPIERGLARQCMAYISWETPTPGTHNLWWMPDDGGEPVAYLDLESTEFGTLILFVGGGNGYAPYNSPQDSKPMEWFTGLQTYKVELKWSSQRQKRTYTIKVQPNADGQLEWIEPKTGAAGTLG